MRRVVVCGSFDNIRSGRVRLLQEASRLGEVSVALWSDETVRRISGADPKFSADERMYLIGALRYVSHVSIHNMPKGPDSLPPLGFPAPSIWVVDAKEDCAEKRHQAASRGIEYMAFGERELDGLPLDAPDRRDGRRKVLVTGCYDWFHSGHVRFFEEVSRLGDLSVVVGSDANVRMLKGEGHPLFSQEVRRYMAGSVRYVTEALISTGQGWMDAEPEIRRIRPDIYAVNEDGDKPEKRAFCEANGIEYAVLRRVPRAGLPRRTSTDLRGF